MELASLVKCLVATEDEFFSIIIQAVELKLYKRIRKK